MARVICLYALPCLKAVTDVYGTGRSVGLTQPDGLTIVQLANHHTQLSAWEDGDQCMERLTYGQCDKWSLYFNHCDAAVVTSFLRPQN